MSQSAAKSAASPIVQPPSILPSQTSIGERETDRQTHRQTDTHTDRQRHRDAGIQRARKRQTDRKTYKDRRYRKTERAER